MIMDYYATLGVAKNATPDEIKKAYRKLASQHHPDKGGDTARFQKIQAAYETLSDPQKKAQYDHPQPQMHGAPGGFSFNFGGGGFEDIFSQIFQQHQHFHQTRTRPIYRARVDISLRESFTGAKKILELNTPQGKKIIDITVPRGVNSHDQLKYDNIIDSGTLIIEFNVMPDLHFDRKGNDLYCNQNISVLDLIAGTTVTFNSIGGKEISVQIKPKTQPYAQIKISGYGMPIVNTEQYGDQYLLLKPFIPDNISQEIIDTILRNRPQ